jgi:hypothetical protein
VLEACVNDGCVRISVSPSITSERGGLVLPDDVWQEVDVFLASATSRRDLLKSLGLGTNRGMLIAGPPGVGKTHLVRVIASELAGRYTTILADANAMRHTISDLYAESDTFGPTLVVLDDIDLVLGHRDSSGTNTSLADFLSTLDGVRQRDDILTIATTNDPKSLDPAAQRSNRFDMVITLPMLGLARLVAPQQAEGSLVRAGGRVVGSSLVGQAFTADRYLQGRPSAVAYGSGARESLDLHGTPGQGPGGIPLQPGPVHGVAGGGLEGGPLRHLYRCGRRLYDRPPHREVCAQAAPRHV